MNRIFIFFLITSALCFSAIGQSKTKTHKTAVVAVVQTSLLPADIAKLEGEDSDKLLNHPTIKLRLKKLLGKKQYSHFMEGFETINPIEKKGNFLFTKGCLIHACGHVESAIAIDLVKQTIHVGIFRETEKIVFFNEQRRKTPSLLISWRSLLEDI
jgi:hypothetical protein